MKDFDNFTKIVYKCGQFGQNNCCHRLWKVGQSGINCPIWSHWSWQSWQWGKQAVSQSDNETSFQKVLSCIPSLVSQQLLLYLFSVNALDKWAPQIVWLVTAFQNGSHTVKHCRAVATRYFYSKKSKIVPTEVWGHTFIKWAIPSLFLFIFVFSIQLTVSIQYKFLPLTEFELQTSGIGSDRSTNWDATTSFILMLLVFVPDIFIHLTFFGTM